MPSVKVFNMKGQETGAMELNDLFEIEYKEALIHQAVVTRLANERQGTKGSLTRSEVRGGGKKPWRQKGTGSARQGSTRAPQWIKGGVVFAPKSRDYSKKMNKIARRTALFSALSQKLRDEEITVIDSIAVAEGKTKEMIQFLDAFKFTKTVLLVMNDNDALVIRSARNIKALQTIRVNDINTYDVVKNAVVVFDQGALEYLQKFYSGEDTEEAME